MYKQIKDCVCSSRSSPPTLPKPQPLPTSITTQAVDGNSFTIMQFNANGIGNKLTELGEFLKRHNVKVTVIQESMLSSNSKTSSIQNFTTVRKDRRQGQGGGLLTLIQKSINFSRKPESPYSGRTSLGGVDHHDYAVRHGVDHYQCLHTPGKFLRMRLCSFPGSPDDDDIPHRTSFNLKKANWDRYRKEIDDKLSKRQLPTSSFVSSNRILPFVYTFSGIFVKLLKVIQSAGMC